MKASDGHPVRLRFSKRGKVRFVSHRDVARAFERAFRTSRLPLAFTLGFSPRPKVSFGLALSVGHESVAEYLDVELREPTDPALLPELLSASLANVASLDQALRLGLEAWASGRRAVHRRVEEDEDERRDEARDVAALLREELTGASVEAALLERNTTRESRFRLLRPAEIEPAVAEYR